MYQVSYKKTAVKALAKMPVGVREKMLAELAAIAADPAQFKGDWKPLSGTPYWRLRVGGYRAVCQLVDTTWVLWVVRVGPRGDVYK